MGQPRPLFRLFSVFSNKHHYNFYNKYMWKKCPSSIWCRDSNPRPSKCESLPITTRPGLPQVDFNFVNFFSFTTRPARHIYSIWTAIWARRTYTRSTRPTSETSHTSSTIAATQTSQYITSGSTVWLVSIVHALSFCHLDIFIVYWMLWKIKIVISMAF